MICYCCLIDLQKLNSNVIYKIISINKIYMAFFLNEAILWVKEPWNGFLLLYVKKYWLKKNLWYRRATDVTSIFNLDLF